MKKTLLRIKTGGNSKDNYNRGEDNRYDRGIKGKHIYDNQKKYKRSERES